MIHSFTFAEDAVVYDPVTQALLLVDPETQPFFEILNDVQEDTGLEGVALAKKIAEELPHVRETSGLSEDMIDELWAELRPVIEGEELYALETPPEVERLYPDEPHIKSMCLHLCHDCNLRCRYCFASTGDYHTGHREMLPLETGKRAIDFLIEASGPRKHLDIDFFGGEPLLNWPVVVELVNYAEQRGEETNKVLRLTITTNAYLLNEERAHFLNDHFKNIVLSFDGRPEVQNHMRPLAGGQDTYERTLRNIKQFVEIRGDREYYVRGTYTRENLDFDKDVLHIRDQGIEQISMEPMVGDPDDPFTLRAEDLAEIKESYARLAKAYVADRKQGKPSFAFFHFNIDIDGGPCLYKRYKGCGSGTEYIAVTPDGSVYPCHQFVGEEDYRMGTVFAKPDELDRTIQAKFYPLIVPDLPECHNCWARYHCGGGCPANNAHATGSLDEPAKLSCELQRARLEAALWIQTQLRSEIV